MIAALAALALRVGVPERLGRAAGIAAAVVGLTVGLGVAKCAYDRSIISTHEAQQAAALAPVIRQADANAAGARISDQKRNQADEDAERAAVAPLPDNRLSDRQLARACVVLERQAAERGGDVPARCRPGR